MRAMCFATDPPYYDNIGYADLSDFFYVWLRRSVASHVWPTLFRTVLTPKDAELIATPHRHGGSKEKARRFFETGLGQAFKSMRAIHDDRFPLSVFYAFKQAETGSNASGPLDETPRSQTFSTGWESMLEGLLASGCTINGTWPMRSELENRMRGQHSNALASSIVLVCRKRAEDARTCSRHDFLLALRRELPRSLRALQAANIAPVDLAQAAIGPGMAIFSRYSKVLEEDGSSMAVRSALGIINQILDEVLAEHDAVYDADTRWAVAWFETHGFEEAAYGDAETLARAKNTSMSGLADAGIVRAKAGRVRLLRRDELDSRWVPEQDARITIWEVVHHLVSGHEAEGTAGAARLLRRVGALAEAARDLAYRLYTVCERRQWSKDGQGYNGLVMSWIDIARAAASESNEVLPLVSGPSSRPGPARARVRGTHARTAVGRRR